MKKILISFLLLVLAAPFVWAVPADPTPYKYVQPDGSVIILQNHGDEYFHWTTDYSTGKIVEKMADGFYRPVNKNLAAEAAKAKELRSGQYRSWSSYDNPPETNFGDRKVLCILANFTDITYSVADPQAHFSNMLNQSGYSVNGAVGSVRDYFIENSQNQYRPQFDVYGPVTLSNNEEYYDINGVDKAILEAYELLSGEITISNYDTDNDGNVDMVLFYFPGYNQAEGAPTETIWPHQSTGNFGMMGSKRLVRYFCTSELKGNVSSNPGKTPASIGTTCHEFSHSLGLPDFYDVDYEGSGGENTTTGPYDLMAGGNYNDGGTKPPYLNAVERNMLGWMPAPPEITASGSFTLEAVQNNKAYKVSSATSGEYFILETRNAQGWDKALSPGLLIYHIDQSDREIDATNHLSAGDLWEYTNWINNYFGHPCFYLVPTVAEPTYWNQYIFPGSNNVTSYILKDWEDSAVLSFTDIAYTGTASTFDITISSHRQVFGKVTDTDGTPLSGVQVSLTPSTGPFTPAPSLLSGSIYCTTDADGNYSLELEDAATANQILRAEKEGYTPSSFNMSISSLYTAQDIVLLQKGEGAPVGLHKYDASGGGMNWSFLGSTEVAVAMRYTAAELAAENAVGGLLKTVSFLTGANAGENVYVVVDIEGEKTLRRNVTASYESNSLVTVDISDANIIIPAGKDIYIGYGLENIATDYPFITYGGFAVDHGGLYRCYDFLTSHSWNGFNYSGTYYDAIISATVSTTTDIEFSTYGVSFIKVEGDTPTVKVAAGKSLKSTEWTLDGAAVATPPATGTLATGSHVYMARLTYYDGTVERVYYEIDK